MSEIKGRNKNKETLTILGVLGATLLAIFLVTEREEIRLRIENLWEKLTQPAVVRFEEGFSPQPPKTEQLKKTKGQVLELIKNLQGTYGVYKKNLETGGSFGINEERIFPAASLIKLPVFVAVYQEVEEGRLSLNTKYELKESDKVAGAGSMYYAPAGTLFSYQKMLELMGKQSDNTAFNVFVKILGGKKIQAVIDSLGMGKTSLVENRTTPADIGLFFQKLYQGEVVSKKNREQIFSFLTDTLFEDRIPAGIPKGVRVVHKVGTEVGVYADAGIVFGPKEPFVLVILSEGAKEAEAKEVLPKIASLVYGLQIN